MALRITIVTPSYQQAAYLEECLRSVAGQGYPEVEHIVVDGGSTDGSTAILERHASGLAAWCSEADRGQAHAINKGLAQATGSVFTWLNSDDRLLPGALATVARWFAEEPAAWAHRGRLVLGGASQPDRVFPEEVRPHDEHHLFHDPLVVQQATFFRSDVLRALGGVEEGLHHVMDLELQWQLLLRHGAEGLRSHPEVLAFFRQHAASKTAQHRPRFLAEHAALLCMALEATGSADLAGIVGMDRSLPTGLRPLPIVQEQAALWRRTAIHFLLKWDHPLHEQGQYRRMRALREVLPLTEGTLTAQQRAWAQQAFTAVDVPGWWAFRAKRKWQAWKGRG